MTRLRKSKTIDTKTVSGLSALVMERTKDDFRSQNIALSRLPEEEREIFEEVTRLGYDVLKTQYEINEYFKAISGISEQKPLPTELCALISFFCEKANPYIAKKPARIKLILPKEKILAETDPEELMMIFSGILANALQNSAPGAEIKVSVSAGKKFAKIETKDSGCGMDEETLLHCAEPFFTSDESKRKKHLGLGLTLTRNFAERYGGRFSVKSEKGKGTAVSILLPMMDKKQNEISVGSAVTTVLPEKCSAISFMLADIG